MKVATKLRILLWWARAKRFLPYAAALIGAALGALLTRKRTPTFDAQRSRDEAIIADAVRPHVAARVEAARSAAKVSVAIANAAHAKALQDAAKVHTATPRELESMLKAYAQKVARLVVLGWALSTSAVHAQVACDETSCTLPVEVARNLLADSAMVDGLHLEVAELTLANGRLEDALTAQGVAIELDDKAIESLALEVADTRDVAAKLRAKLDAWYRKPWLLVVAGVVGGVAATLAVAL